MSTATVDERLDLIRSMPTPILPKDRYRHKIDALGLNGFFRFGGETFKVTGVAKWKTEASESVELEATSLQSGETCYFEWWNDLGLKASRSIKQLEWRALGITEAELEAGQDSLRADGREYAYDDDYPATYISGDGSKEAYLYAFVLSERRRTLSVQKWPDGYDVWISEDFNPNNVEVLVLGETRANG